MISARHLLEPLVTALQENLTARYEHHRRTIGQKTAGEAAQALFGHLNPGHARFGFEDCKYWYGRCMLERGRGDADMLLQRHGISNIRNLPSDMYDRFGDYAKTCVLFGISPHFAWHGKHDIPEDLRTRFLVSHPESDDLFICNNINQFETLMQNSPECDEVTGVDHFEERILQMIENGEDVYIHAVVKKNEEDEL